LFLLCDVSVDSEVLIMVAPPDRALVSSGFR